MSRFSPAPRPLFWSSLLIGLLAAGCAGTASAPEGPDKAQEKKGADEAADEELELTHKLEVARLELELARLEAAQDLDCAERELVEARLSADEARIEREAFTQIGRQHALDEAGLSLDRSRGRAEDAAAELAELESMYAAEEFATKTKELVLTRSRRDLEHSMRSLDLAKRKLVEVESFDLPAKESHLEQGALAGQKGLLEAEQALEKLRLKKKIELTKAEVEVGDLERKLEKIVAKKKKGSS